MQRLFHGLLFILFLTLPATAQISDPYVSITKEGLRTAIYAGEVRKVEAAFREAQAKFLRGEASVDDLRWLNEIFTTTHPDVISFIESMAQAIPQFTLCPYGSGIKLLQCRLDYPQQWYCAPDLPQSVN